MPFTKKVSNPPLMPLLIIDGGCPFCQRWGRRLNQWTGIHYVPYQEWLERFSEISKNEFERSVQFIEPNGDVFSGAAAAFKMLSHRTGLGWALWLYQKLPAFARISERMYEFISRNRHSL